MIRIVRVPLPHLHSVALVAWLRGGPRYEGPRESGLTHLLEHMIFRGTKDNPEPRELMAAFEAAGGEPSAHTGDDELGVSLEVAPDRVARGARLLGQVLLRPVFRDLAREKRIVREELLDLVDEAGDPADLDDIARRLVFGAHPLGRSVIGGEADVKRFGRRDLERHRARLVRDENLVVALAGPVTAADEKVVARELRAVPAGPALTDPLPLPRPRGPTTGFVRQGVGEGCDVRLSFLAPGEASGRTPALQVLASVLDGGPLARLPLRLVDAGYVHAAELALVPFPDLTLVELDLTVSGPRLAVTFTRALDVLRSVAREGLERGEVARARERLLRRRSFARDDALGEAEWAARRALFGLDASRDAERRALERVTAREVVAVAALVIRPERFAGVFLGRPPAAQRRGVLRAVERFCRDAGARQEVTP